ncbi:unnamed protein product [Rotaria sp. Silwood1]|nr:unnamed protein product [Rotaria sp. Silwood1]CAF1691278.1 unnamed protein product [Rotaria sp. Silwood1]CAF3879380.1 unnamed protein product [Rotaria sp. Silwood1]CAF5033731.1 unnamed protein product [Rotaria sp. Silwood1]
MSTGDAHTQDQLAINYDLVDSAASNLIFNRSTISKASPQPISIDFHEVLPEQIPSVVNVMNNEHVFVNSPTHSPILGSRPNSAHNYIYDHDTHQHDSIYPSTSPPYIQQLHETSTTLPAKATSPINNNTLTSAAQIRYLQEALYKSNAALEHRDTEINNLRKEIHEIRDFQLISGKTSPNASTNISPRAVQNSHTFAFVPILATDKPQPVTLPTNIFTSPLIMPFTMSLTNTLPSFSGKEGEMPTKFITEFEIRASGLVGHHDDYLLRAVQQSLSDTALTWYIQIQQEQLITNWEQFKQLFLRRFRTPEKIELLHGRLHTL